LSVETLKFRVADESRGRPHGTNVGSAIAASPRDLSEEIRPAVLIARWICARWDSRQHHRYHHYWKRGNALEEPAYRVKLRLDTRRTFHCGRAPGSAMYRHLL